MNATWNRRRLSSLLRAIGPALLLIPMTVGCGVSAYEDRREATLNQLRAPTADLTPEQKAAAEQQQKQAENMMNQMRNRFKSSQQTPTPETAPAADPNQPAPATPPAATPDGAAVPAPSGVAPGPVGQTILAPTSVSDELP